MRRLKVEISNVAHIWKTRQVLEVKKMQENLDIILSTTINLELSGELQSNDKSNC